jgi:hypothetical protein
MSGHLIGCVKPIQDLPRAHKLALMAFADSGDDRTHIALPGYEGVMEWVGCGRSRAADLIRDLTAWGYLRQHKRGHRGQRAEWIVFPNGCCDTHRAPAAEETIDVDALARAAGVDVEQARLLLTALGHDAPSGKGSSRTGPNERGKGPTQEPDPIDQETDDYPQAGENPRDNHRQRPESVRDPRVTADAVTTSKTPPTPTGKPAGARCARHPDGHANCRACGTTARQRADADRRAKAEQHRAAQAALTAAARRDRQLAAPPPAGLRNLVAAAAAAEAAAARQEPT